MTTSDIVAGSWFPTGYYGHFRNKFRNDFVCEYRQLARPPPPQKFINRSVQPTRKHVFTHHDNRQAFLNDALIFQLGLGKRRDPNCKNKFKPDFITWIPEREYVERGRPFVSSYRVDYKDKTPGARTCKVPVPQISTKRPMTSFDGISTTTHRYAHGNDAPNKEAITAVNRESLKFSLMNRKTRAASAKRDYRETVASCMVWQSDRSTTDSVIRPKSEAGRPSVPSATQTTTFIPHPSPTIRKEKHFDATNQSAVTPPLQSSQEIAQNSPAATHHPPLAVQSEQISQMPEISM